MSDSESLAADLQEQNRLLAEQNRQLHERMSALEARIPAAEPTPLAPGVHQEYPRAVYRKTDKPSIDHPGNEARTAVSQADFDAALAEGWSPDPLPYEYELPVVAAVAESKNPPKKPNGRK